MSNVTTQTQQTVLKGPQSEQKHIVHFSEKEKYSMRVFHRGCYLQKKNQTQVDIHNNLNSHNLSAQWVLVLPHPALRHPWTRLKRRHDSVISFAALH